MVLLTSGQVSVAISSFVVFMFTSALFLSGYVLQQQTVRDLRAAIQPKPTPQNARLYLPTQFAVQPTPSPKADVGEDLGEVNRERTETLVGIEGVVEVKESRDDLSTNISGQRDDFDLDDTIEGGLQRTRRPAQDGPVSSDSVEGQKPMVLAEEPPPGESDTLQDASSMVLTEGQAKKEKQLSRAERRKKIKEEILAAGEGEGFKGYKRRQW